MMKKGILITSAVVSVAFLLALVLPAVHAYPNSYPIDDVICVCDHWDPSELNTIYDQYTGTSIVGHYSSPGHYQYTSFIFQAGYGGWFLPAPGSPTSQYWYYGYRPYGIIYSGSSTNSSNFDYPVRAFPPSTFNYHARTNRMTISTQPLDMSKGLTQQWFYRQDGKGFWLCGTQWAYVYTS